MKTLQKKLRRVRKCLVLTCFDSLFSASWHQMKAMWIIIASGLNFTTKQFTEVNRERIFILTKIRGTDPQSSAGFYSCRVATDKGGLEVCVGFITASLSCLFPVMEEYSLCLVGDSPSRYGAKLVSISNLTNVNSLLSLLAPFVPHQRTSHVSNCMSALWCSTGRGRDKIAAHN